MTKRNASYGSHAEDTPQPRKKAERFDGARFVNYELDKAGQAACKAWKLTEEESFRAIQSLCDKGYAIAISFDTYSESYACWLRHKKGEGPNAGLILPGRGSTPAKAVKQALYKHFEVMGEVWELFVSASRAELIDD